MSTSIEVDGKGHERGLLPLPIDIGDALVHHLMLRGRRVFLPVRAPIRPIVPTAVRIRCSRRALAAASRIYA